MAVGDTDVGIVNKALLFLGSDVITSFNDGTPQATISKQLYNEVKQSTLGMYRWSFTIAKQQLARDTVTPNSEWTYQYLLPNDMITGVPEAVRTTGSPGGALYQNWEINQSKTGGAVLMLSLIHI